MASRVAARFEDRGEYAALTEAWRELIQRRRLAEYLELAEVHT